VASSVINEQLISIIAAASLPMKENSAKAN